MTNPPPLSLEFQKPLGTIFLSPVLIRILKYWLPVAAWMTVIFMASTGLGTMHHTSRFIEPVLRWLMPWLTQDQLDWVHFCVRKCSHALEYALLALLLWRAFNGEPGLSALPLRRRVVLVILLSAFYAGTDEFHQLFVSQREAAVHDVVLDTFGASLGLGMLGMVGSVWKKLKGHGGNPKPIQNPNGE